MPVGGRRGAGAAGYRKLHALGHALNGATSRPVPLARSTRPPHTQPRGIVLRRLPVCEKEGARMPIKGMGGAPLSKQAFLPLFLPRVDT